MFSQASALDCGAMCSAEQQGINGPPSMMRLEHDQLREKKKALGDRVEEVDKLTEAEFWTQLNELAGYIVPTLRSHIFKEDNILYPTALRVIPQGEWSRIRTEFDKIGYCSFTPKRIMAAKQ